MSIYEEVYVLIFFGVISLCLGAVMGSFLNCAAYRIAKGESFVKGKSKCPSCGHELGAKDLVPVFSWLALKGKCRYCGGKVSPRYMITEIVFALLTLGCLLRFDLTPLCLRNYIFICCLFCLSLVDLEAYIIPNGCVIIPALAWAAFLPFSGMKWQEILIQIGCGVGLALLWLLVSLVLDKILKKESLGGGDVKLFAVVGLYFGIYGSVFVTLLSCILGLALGSILKKISKSEEGGQIPFGPAIALASLIMLFAGEPLIEWYRALLGV